MVAVWKVVFLLPSLKYGIISPPWIKERSPLPVDNDFKNTLCTEKHLYKSTT